MAKVTKNMVLLVFVLAWQFLSYQYALAAPPAFTAQVTHVYDGDSFAAKGGQGKLKVRIFGIDCPDKGQPWADKARAFAKSRLQGRSVRIQPVDRDKWGRVVAKVYLSDGRDLGLVLLQEGLAWWYSRYAPGEKAYARAWWSAVKSGKGLWSAAEPPMLPSDWRRAHQ